MTNIDQTTLTSLLTGKLAFKVYNKDSSEWETLKVFNPELETHAGAKASTYESGHVMLVTDLESESEELAATAKAVGIVFEALSIHVNEDETHINNMERIKWNGYSNSANISYSHEEMNATNVKEAINELLAAQNEIKNQVANSMVTLRTKLTDSGKEVPENATFQDMIDLV